MSQPLKIDMTFEEYLEMNEYTHKGGGFYEDAGGGIVYEDSIIEEMEAEYPESKDN